jgi:hypothetical protein
MALTWQTLRLANAARAWEFHPPIENAAGGVLAWTMEQWAACVLGEIGEAANALKKTWRGDGAVTQVIEELCDVIIYCDLALARSDFAVTLSPVVNTKGLVAVVDAAEVDARQSESSMLVEMAGLVSQLWSADQGDVVCAVNEIAFIAAAIMRRQGCIDVAAALVNKFNDTSDTRGCAVYIDENGLVPMRFHDTQIGTPPQCVLQARVIQGIDERTGMWVEEPSPRWSVGGTVRSEILHRMQCNRRMGMRRLWGV